MKSKILYFFIEIYDVKFLGLSFVILNFWLMLFIQSLLSTLLVYSKYVNTTFITCITAGYLFRIKQKGLLYFQLEVDYYSKKVNKNKYKNFKLIALAKNNI